MKLNSSQLDLIVAALNFCNLQKKLFINHLENEGHPDAAKYTNQQIERLRRKVTQEYHLSLEDLSERAE